MISRAPFKGLRVNVFSPITAIPPRPNAARTGIISRVRSPDSPVWRLSRSNAAVPRPFMVNADVSLRTLPSLYVSPTVTSAPSERATEMAASLSPHGEYPFNVVVPSANAAAIIARCAKLFDDGIGMISMPSDSAAWSSAHPAACSAVCFAACFA